MEMRAPVKQYRKQQIGKCHRAVHDLPIELNPVGRTTLAVQIYRDLGGDRNRGLASGAKLPSGANSRPGSAFSGAPAPGRTQHTTGICGIRTK